MNGGGGREGEKGSESGELQKSREGEANNLWVKDEEWEPLVRSAPLLLEFKGYYQTWASRIDSEHGPVLFPKSSHRQRVGSGEQRLALVQLGRLELREFKYPGAGSFSSTQKAAAAAVAVAVAAAAAIAQDDAGFGNW
ncbi:hypothetical protein ASPBRDRAFT_57678 [Aspergillus brasiliensis CBS 101740]|uniref:Uncharacterized protein n=1 Tax=Aspergillus brasiliensis (strain CBS 101740 / IMI 381727 / IBT 21946) TaxID=767769 RepID=A0A1L9UBX0_ASPBC|nr:hypothetical protein ASPBRDRAFT_57678 [Aspergillus brasiliensis CBS 101740]